MPDVVNLRASSASVAVAVAEQAKLDGVAQVDLSDPVEAVEATMWNARYADVPTDR